MTTPAGWYPDPEQTSSSGDSRTLRWWDGSTWTDHRTEQESAPAQAATGWGAGPATGSGSAPGSSGPSGGWSAAPSATGQGSWSGGKATATPAGELIGSRGSRFGARIIDGIITGIVGGLLALPFFLPLVESFQDYLDEVTADPTGSTASNPFGFYTQPGVAVNFVLATVVTLAVSAVYEIVFLALKGATPGKMALGLRVRPWDASTGSGPGLGWGRAAGRWAVQVLPAQVVGLWSLLDAAWCLWDPRKQTLHDKIVGTVVVSTRR